MEDFSEDILEKVEVPNIKVYIKIDEKGNVTAVNSGIFLLNTDGWLEIDEGTGDMFAHAQGNYFDKPLMNWNGVYNYKYDDGKVMEYIN